MLKGQSAVKWSFAPLETLYDVDSIIARWTETGIAVRQGFSEGHFLDRIQSPSRPRAGT